MTSHRFVARKQLLLLLAAQHRYTGHAAQRFASTAIVVLGQSLKPNGLPSKTLLNRAKKAADLYSQSEQVSILIPTGGDPAGAGISEADVMHGLLLKQGVAGEHMYLENKSQNTVQNAVYVHEMLQTLGSRRILLVTSDFHMPRASYIFETILGDQIEILPNPAASGCPAADAPEVANVNDWSLSQRLKGELHWINRDMGQTFFVDGLPAFQIPSPNRNRLHHAIYEVNSQLDALKGATILELHAEQGKSCFAFPAFILYVTAGMVLGIVLGMRTFCCANRYRSLKDGQLDERGVTHANVGALGLECSIGGEAV